VSTRLPGSLSRRHFLATGGALVVSFALPLAALAAAPDPTAQNAGKVPQPQPRLPGSLKKAPYLDAWIRIGGDSTITVFTGKAELGQGIKTALLQVVAVELGVEPPRLALVTADTARTPNEGYTAGSHSMQDSGTALMNAAAQVREILLDLASRALDTPRDQLTADKGVIKTVGGRTVQYGALVKGEELHVEAQPQSVLRDPKRYTVMGKSLARVDIPGKVAGGVSYVHDLRLPQMVHARVVRPPRHGARLAGVDTAGVEKMPGVLKAVRNGSFLAVIAEREYQAIAAMRALSRAAKWDGGNPLPAPDLHKRLLALPTQDLLILGDAGTPQPGEGAASAAYTRP
jgi:CO/xanthine dehydrogenase Mo-binding subunit